MFPQPNRACGLRFREAFGLRCIPPLLVAQAANCAHYTPGREGQSGGIGRTPNASRYSVAALPRNAVWPEVYAGELGKGQRIGIIARLADYKSAIQQIENLRYERRACSDFSDANRAVTRSPNFCGAPLN